MNKNKNKIIFLDLDGVLVNFVKGSLAELNVDIKDIEIPARQYDMTKWGNIGVKNQEEFWQIIDKKGAEFWAGLEKYPWADELVDYCLSKAKVFFLTSPARNPLCSAGKMEWIQKYYPKLRRNVVLTPAKYLCANKNALLIDDSEHKIFPFKNAGGNICIFPQLWNSNFGYPTHENKMKFVKTMIDNFLEK